LLFLFRASPLFYLAFFPSEVFFFFSAIFSFSCNDCRPPFFYTLPNLTFWSGLQSGLSKKISFGPCLFQEGRFPFFRVGVYVIFPKAFCSGFFCIFLAFPWTSHFASLSVFWFPFCTLHTSFFFSLTVFLGPFFCFLIHLGAPF